MLPPGSFRSFSACPDGVNPTLFALFLAIAMSISALPVIVKTLRDLNLYRTDFGMVVVSAAIFNDLVGWIIFAVILGMIDNTADLGGGITRTVGMALGFVLFVFTLGRKLIHKLLPYVQAYTWWPGGEIGFVIILSLLGAAFTEWIGIHAIFGAFFIGMAVGDSLHLRVSAPATSSISSSPAFFRRCFLPASAWGWILSPILTGRWCCSVLSLACLCKLLRRNPGRQVGWDG